MFEYPWHKQTWQQLAAYEQQRGLAHAFIISGAKGLAKSSLVQQVAKHLLCTQKSLLTPVCGRCFACSLPSLPEHPDYFLLEPEEDSKTIKIEQIRLLIEALQQTGHRAGNRIIIIRPAEAMNLAAANALLKTLEEPGANCYFWLITSNVNQLPITIRSRCQMIKMSPAFELATQQWVAQQANISMDLAAQLLKQAEGAPQSAVALQEEQAQLQPQLLEDLLNLAIKKQSFIQIAQQWHKQIAIVLEQLIRLLNQLIQQRYQAQTNDVLMALPTKKLINFSVFLLEKRKEWIINPNLNTQLLSETIAAYWITC